MQGFSQRGKWKWVGGWHYFVFTFKCYSIGICKYKIMPPTHPFPFSPLTKPLHTPLISAFYLCTSTNFWKTTCQYLPHFHSHSQWSYHHGTIQYHQFQ